MSKRFSILVLLVFICNSLSAQKENNNWFFGNGAAINFNTNGNVTNIKNSELYTDEGVASVSDKNGKLLFYTDGVTVWNAKHLIIQGGINLLGHKSATQSATIVPHPAKENLYYIFTVTEKGGQHGLCYSIVDISKNNNDCAITEKNVLIFTPVSEKLTVAKHNNGTDFWIITHKWNSNEFCSFLINKKGVVKAPVISKIGTTHKDIGSGNNGEAIGQIKISPNQKKLAVALTYKPNQAIEIFDFDNKTGSISNLREIPTSGFTYGLEFSPNNTKLYASFLKGNFGVIQYDLEVDDIFEDGTTTLSLPKGFENFGALQLGPDNKIYVAKTGRYLDVIENPNAKGISCNYIPEKVNLNDKTCVYGLPPFVYTRNISAITEDNPNLSEEKPIESENEIPTQEIDYNNVLCTETVTLDAGKPNMVYLWSTGEKTQTIIVNKPGTYSVVISHPTNISSESQSFTVSSGKPKVDLGQDLKLTCEASFDLDAKNVGFEYKWSTGSKAQTLTVRETGTYSVTVTNGACSASDEIMIEFINKPPMFKALTSFSPNNTSFNSFFDYSVQGINEFELIVKNEKGKTVFKTNNPKEKWNGIDKKRELFPVGDYPWIVKYKGPCTSGEYVIKEGSVRLY